MIHDDSIDIGNASPLYSRLQGGGKWSSVKLLITFYKKISCELAFLFSTPKTVDCRRAR